MYLYSWKVPPSKILQDYNCIDDISNVSNVRHSIIEWLRPNSDEDDIVLIYIVTHGRGALKDGSWPREELGNPVKARIDESGDEGNEFYNNTGEKWFGVDEGLWFYNDNSIYWNDDFRQDLNELPNCTQIVILQACVSENETCFCGGFIDDLSASNRIIITSSNETYYSFGDCDGDGFSEFSGVFIDALHGYDTSWDYSNPSNPIKHETLVDADFDGNGRVSMQEAFNYALKHDEYDPNAWLDCDGDGLPTFINGQDTLDLDQPPANVYLEVAVCAMKTLTNGYFYIPNFDVNTLKIEFLFSNSHLEGDQTHTSPPYETISHWPSGTVDVSDLAFVLGKVGKSEGSTDWDYMADVIPTRAVDISDLVVVINNIPSSGNYITDLSGVTVVFNIGGEKSPDSDGYATIPQGANYFTVYRSGDEIGALITFWRTP